MAAAKYQTKKTYHIEVDKQLLLLDVFIVNSNDKENSSKSGKKHVSRKSWEWFKEDYIIELLKGLQGIVLGRINRPITRASQQSFGNSHDIATQNLRFNYCFKQRFGIVKQYALRRSSKIFHHLNVKNRKNEQTNYESLPYFHEKLVVNVWQPVRKSEQILDANVSLSKVSTKKEIVAKPCTPTSSDYFTEQTEQEATTSVKRKKASLKNMAKKSKIALLRLSHEQSESSDSVTEHGDTNVGSDIVFTSSNSSKPCETERDIDKERTVIDLEKEPEGLMEVKRVEDLHLDQIKFLINKMEEYLRSIFCGEVYCRRHEDYKKGGKARDNLNFQVGMAHFSEDQHDCVMDTLMTLFCYNKANIWRYLDYVTKVMLPEALIKLYQDIHQTSFEQAEECLLNDTVL